jgi:hypothetical protein
MTVAELTVPILGPEILAKRDGSCKGCTAPVLAGEHYIRKVEGRGWMHSLCAAGYCRVIEEHVTDGVDDASEES